MSVKVIPILTTIDDADDNTDWSTGATNTAAQIQGGGCLEHSAGGGAREIVYYNIGSTIDLTDTHIYVWCNAQFAPNLDPQLSGGIAIHIGDGTNYHEWYVGGNDTYLGGWKCFVAWTGLPFDDTQGAGQSTSSCQYVGFSFVDNTSIKAGIINFYSDALRYGSGVQITSGSIGDICDFDQAISESISLANAYGIIGRNPDTDIIEVQGELYFGTASAEQTYFQDSGQTLIFMKRRVSPDLYKIVFEGNTSNDTTIIFGESVNTGSDTIAINPINISVPTASSRFPFDMSDNRITSANLYGLTIRSAREISIGTGSSPLTGSNIELVGCRFVDTYQITRDISGSTLQLDNVASFTTASSPNQESPGFRILDDKGIDGTDFSFIQTYGLTSGDDDVEETITVEDTDFSSLLKNITVYTSKSWDVVDPSWTINTASQDELFFASDTGNEVNEKFSINLATRFSSGEIITGSAIFVYEGLKDQNIPTSGSTDSNGEFSSTILTRRFTSGSSDLIVTGSGEFALKVYRYPFSPFIGSITVDSAIISTVTLITDGDISAATSESAIAAGAGISASVPAYPSVLLSFTDTNTTFSVGEVVTGGSSAASGTIIEVAEYDSGLFEGKFYLDPVSSDDFTNGEELNGSVGGASMATASVSSSFTWRVDCNSYNLQVVYDYLAAKMSEVPIDTIYRDAVSWGEAEQSQLLYTGPSGYYTERNVSNEKGVYLSNKGVGTIEYMTSDDGATYTPPAQVTLEIQGAPSGAQCAVITYTAGPEVANTQLMNEAADAAGYASQPYTYKGDQPVLVRVRYRGWLPFSVNTSILSTGLSVTAVAIEDPVYDPSY